MGSSPAAGTNLLSGPYDKARIALYPTLILAAKSRMRGGPMHENPVGHRVGEHVPSRTTDAFSVACSTRGTGCPFAACGRARFADRIGRLLTSRWRDLPERYGKWTTVHRHLSQWCHVGVLGAGVRATKIHMLADTLGRPLRFIVTAGQRGEGQAGGAALPTRRMTPMPCAPPSPPWGRRPSSRRTEPEGSPLPTTPRSPGIAPASNDASAASSTSGASPPATSGEPSTSTASPCPPLRQSG